MVTRTLVYGAGGDFDPIRPDESDLFSFDFTVPAAGVAISTAGVTCSQAIDSPVNDPGAAGRVLNSPQIVASVIKALVGTGVNGVFYTLTASATMNDGRVLVFSGDFECTLRPLPVTDPILTPAKFRQDFVTFTNPRDYPDETIAFWINIALNQGPLDANRWGNLILLGQELFVAHMLTLEKQNQLQTRRGRAALAIGPAVSRSVGGVSVSYDLSGAYSDDAGFWNLSSYGQRYWYFLNQAGMGPVQF
jgi:hypothetical protein